MVIESNRIKKKNLSYLDTDTFIANIKTGDFGKNIENDTFKRFDASNKTA